jgi:hypothetical protein
MGDYRVLLEVDPTEIGDRVSDEMPAQAGIDWIALLKSIGVKGKADVRTVQVMQIDPKTGRPTLYSDYAYQRGPYDRAFSWYDNAIPYDFPEVLSPSSRSDGERPRKNTTRAGYMYNAVGDWKAGKLAWSHTRFGNKPSYYAVYFDRMDADASPPEAPPTGWIGDGMPRHDRWSDSTTGADTTQATLDDWNDDGLIDIVYGEQYGQLFYMLNQGTRESPAFGPSRMIFEEDGKPLDIGVHASPLVIDWDGDGVKDLLIGTYQNRIGFFRNTGTNKKRTFEFKGFLRDSTGKFLALPVTPVAQNSEGVFKEDYFPVMAAADWEGDGDIDLLCGGYITGRIYFYRNIGRHDGLPKLELVGPVEADGKPINVHDWCAAPCVADLNGDGLPDLVNGYTVHLNAGVGKPYFWTRNVSVLPAGVRIDHPVDLGDGHFYPYLDDMDRDGKMDVLFGDWHGNIWFHHNESTDQEQKFDIQGQKLRTTDGKNIKVGPVGGDTEHDFQALQGARTTLVAGDYNGDGLDDLVVGDTYGKVRFYRNVGPLKSPRFAPPKLIADLKTRLHVEKGDWNRDGRLDVIVSSSSHKIYVILNEGPAGECNFDQPKALELEIKGPISMVTDLNRDGDDDLLINGAQGTSFVERSFAEHGYANGRVLAVEARTKTEKAGQ